MQSHTSPPAIQSFAKELACPCPKRKIKNFFPSKKN